MSNFGLRLDLLKFYGSQVVEMHRNGETVKCIAIPIDDNGIFVNKDGSSAYANFKANAMNKVNQYGSTHYIKLVLSKEAYLALSDEEKKNQPLFGFLKALDGNNASHSASHQSQGIPQYDRSKDISVDDLPW